MSLKANIQFIKYLRYPRHIFNQVISNLWKGIPLISHHYYISLLLYIKNCAVSNRTWRCRCWLSVNGRGWLRVVIVIFSLAVASLRIAELITLINVGAACWQVLLCRTVYPILPSSVWLSITIAPYLHLCARNCLIKENQEMKEAIRGFQ